MVMQKGLRLCLSLLGVTVLACSAHPPNPNALLQENACVQYLQLKDYNNAQIRCQLCLEYDDAIPECYNGLGLAAYAQGFTQKAIDFFTKALRKNNNFAQARNNLGAIYFQQGDFTQALKYFKDAVEEDPGYQDGRYNLGLTYLRIGQRAMGLNDQVTARTNFGLAKNIYEKLIALHPKNVSAYRDLGVLMTYEASMEQIDSNLKSDLNQAVVYFQQCLQLDPHDEPCNESYGHTLLFQNQFDKALYQFVQCLSTNAKNPECIKGMELAYAGSKLKSEALDQYIAMIKGNPKDANGHFGYCQALFNNGMTQMGAEQCQLAVQLNPKLCAAHYRLSLYYKQVLDAAQAQASCQQFLLCSAGNNPDPAQVSKCQQIITAVSGPADRGSGAP